MFLETEGMIISYYYIGLFEIVEHVLWHYIASAIVAIEIVRQQHTQPVSKETLKKVPPACARTG